jgi:Domain of unknown function (DUF4440)
MPVFGRRRNAKIAADVGEADMDFRLIAPFLVLVGWAFAAKAEPVESELRRNTQALLDAIAPGDVTVWDRLLDPKAIQVDENDMVRDKAQILADLKPIGPGLTGNLQIDDFRVALYGDVAVVTHEDKEYLDYHGQVLHSRFRMTDTWRRTEEGWRLLGEQELAVQQDPPSVAFDSKACAYAGRYGLTNDIVATISCQGDMLAVERAGKPLRTFLAETPDVFFEPGFPRTRRIFQRDAGGHVTGFVDRREERDIAWKRLP